MTTGLVVVLAKIRTRKCQKPHKKTLLSYFLPNFTDWSTKINPGVNSADFCRVTQGLLKKRRMGDPSKLLNAYANQI